MVRAKFVLTGITEHNHPSKTLRFDCVYDQNIPDDQRFQKATPFGHIEIQIDNPTATEQFVRGQSYYVDFTPVIE